MFVTSFASSNGLLRLRMGFVGLSKSVDLKFKSFSIGLVGVDP